MVAHLSRMILVSHFSAQKVFAHSKLALVESNKHRFGCASYEGFALRFWVTKQLARKQFACSNDLTFANGFVLKSCQQMIFTMFCNASVILCCHVSPKDRFISFVLVTSILQNFGLDLHRKTCFIHTLLP